MRLACGKKGNNHNKTMTITQEQREGFVRMLQEAKQNQQQRFERELERRAQEEFLPKLVERQGLAHLVDKIGKLSVELTDSARALQTVGVLGKPTSLFDRLVRPDDVNEALERMKRPYHEQLERSMRDYDLAILRVLSAQSLEEAREVVESLV